MVAIRHGGQSGATERTVADTLDATQGFTIVLCDLKTLLEQGTAMNLVRDKAALIAQRLAGERRSS